MNRYLRSSMQLKLACRARVRHQPPFVKKVGGFYGGGDENTIADDVMNNYPAYQIMVERFMKVKDIYAKKNYSKKEDQPDGTPYYVELLDKVDRDPQTGIFLNAGFDQIFADIKKYNYSYKKAQPFTEARGQLVSGLSSMNEFQLMEALKMSVALRLSQDNTKFVQGSILAGLLKDYQRLHGEKDPERLRFRAALAFVTAKVESIFQSKTRGSSYEAAEFVRLVRMNGRLDPASYGSIDFLRRIYPLSAKNLKEEGDSLSASARLSEREGQAERKIMQNFLGKRISDKNSMTIEEETVDGENEIQFLIDFFAQEQIENYEGEFKPSGGSINETEVTMDAARLEKLELAGHISRIVGNHDIVQSLEGEISRLEALLGFHDGRSLTHEVLSGQLDLLISKLPPSLVAKYIIPTTETESSFNARYANNTDSFLSLQWNNVDLEVPAKFMPVKEYKQFHDLKTNFETYAKYAGVAQTSAALGDDLELHSHSIKPEYVYRNRDDVVFRAGTEYVNLDFDDTVPLRLTEKLKEAAALIREDRDREKAFAGPLQLAHFKSALRKSRLLSQDARVLHVDTEVNQIKRNQRVLDFFEEMIEQEEIAKANQKNPPTFKTEHQYSYRLPRDKLNLFRTARTDDTYIIETGWVQNNRLFKAKTDVTYLEENHSLDSNFITGVYHPNVEGIEDEIPETKSDGTIFKHVEDAYAGSAMTSHVASNAQKAAADFLVQIRKDGMYKHYFEGAFMLSQTLNPTNYKMIKGDSLETKELNGKILSQKDMFDQGIIRLESDISKKGFKPRQNLMSKYTEILQTGWNFDREKVKDTYCGRAIRKRATAFAFVSKKGEGKLTVNHRDFIEYFNVPNNRFMVIKSIAALNLCDKIDVQLYVYGGGTSSQAEACLVAISKALYAAYPEQRQFLLDHYFTFTDSRKVQMKNTGLYKARKKYAYVHR